MTRSRVQRSRWDQALGGFSLLEVLIALAVLLFGLLSVLAILQQALRASEPIEFETRAALLAESILEGIRSHPEGGFPFIPGLNPTTWPVIPDGVSIYSTRDSLLLDQTGSPYNPQNLTTGMTLPFVFNIPGNGVDEDATAAIPAGGNNGPWTDNQKLNYDARNGNILPENGSDGVDDFMHDQLIAISSNVGLGRPLRNSKLIDSDGSIELAISRQLLLSGGVFIQSATDSDGDGIPQDTGDSAFLDENGNIVFFNNEVYSLDQIQPAYRPDGDFTYDPQRGIDEELSNGVDDDNDGLTDEDLALASQQRVGTSSVSQNPYDYLAYLAGNGLDDDGDGEVGSPVDPVSGKQMADGLDNDGNGRIDEGIDEEIYDGRDNDSDGNIDEDCQGAHVPWQPIPFPSPNEEYSFRLTVSRLPLGGDGLDDDGDAFRIGRVVPDANGQPVPVEYDANRDGQLTPEDVRWVDEEFYDGVDNDGDGLIDEDLAAYAAPRARLITVSIFRGDDRKDNDGDGWIDEEAADGIDNDGDGRIDEDNYRGDTYRTSGIAILREQR